MFTKQFIYGVNFRLFCSKRADKEDFGWKLILHSTINLAEMKIDERSIWKIWYKQLNCASYIIKH